MHGRILGLLAMFWLVSACAPANNANDYDPLEPVNRQIFAFNQVLDEYILEPAARGYRYVVPAEGREGVNNVLSNLKEPVNMLNALLQADPEQMFTSFWRFVLNSTFGLGGISDFAGTYANLKHREEDFGQTLGTWGADTGPYLVLPIFGPSNVRDALGSVVDAVSDPFNRIMWDSDNSGADKALIARSVISGIAAREQLLEPIEAINEDSLDPYASFRSAYTQKRRSMINNSDKRGPLAVE